MSSLERTRTTVAVSVISREVKNMELFALVPTRDVIVREQLNDAWSVGREKEKSPQ